MLLYLHSRLTQRKQATMIRLPARQTDLFLRLEETRERFSEASEAELINLLGQLIQTVPQAVGEEISDEQDNR